MKVLVACEESQRVCTAFRNRGHEAYSCDILQPSGGHPEWHIHQDVTPLINGDCFFYTMDGEGHYITSEWDLLIAHPPCTYLSIGSACRMYPTAGNIDPVRYEMAMQAKSFFMLFLNSNAKRICVENPRPLSVVKLPKHSQIIQPYWFGEPWSKTTLLWLRNLPDLQPTNIIKEHRPYVSTGTSRSKGNSDKSGYSRKGGSSIARSKTFIGIANAMAEQWG